MAGLDKAGFKVTLNGIAQTRTTTVQNPAQRAKFDVMWAGWGADWPSGSTVIPPLFDSRVNLTADSNGSGLRLLQGRRHQQGRSTRPYADAGRRRAVRRRGATSTRPSRRKVGSSRSDNQKFMFIWGSGVKNYIDNASCGGYVELAAISVK